MDWLAWLLLSVVVGSPAVASVELLVTVAVDRDDAAAHRDFRRPSRYGAGPRADALLDQLAAAHDLRRAEGWPIRALSVYCAVLEADDAAHASRALAGLRNDPRVDSAQRMQVHHTRARTLDATGDPLRHLQASHAALRLHAAHALSRGGGVRVAIVDAGIDRRHPELRGQVVLQQDFTGQPRGAHGTAVAGLIGAVGDNGVGILGIAPDATLLDLQACWPEQPGSLHSRCTSLSLARGLDAAIDSGAAVVTLALGGPEDPLLARLVTAAVAAGASVVAAAGPARGFPGSHPEVIAAAAAGDRALAGGIVQLPASALLTTFPGGAFDFVGGDSFAAAQVAGLVALLRARQPALGPAEVRAALLARHPLDALVLLQADGARQFTAH